MAHSFAGPDTATITRRILGSWARRYIGVAVGVGAFLIFVIIAPSRSPISTPFTLPSAAGADTPQAPAAGSPQTANTPQAAGPTGGSDGAGGAPAPAFAPASAVDLTASTIAPAPASTTSGPAPQPEPAPAPPDSPPQGQPGAPGPSPQPCQPLIPSILGTPPVCGP